MPPTSSVLEVKEVRVTENMGCPSQSVVNPGLPPRILTSGPTRVQLLKTYRCFWFTRRQRMGSRRPRDRAGPPDPHSRHAATCKGHKTGATSPPSKACRTHVSRLLSVWVPGWDACDLSAPDEWFQHLVHHSPPGVEPLRGRRSVTHRPGSGMVPRDVQKSRARAEHGDREVADATADAGLTRPSASVYTGLPFPFCLLCDG